MNRIIDIARAHDLTHEGTVDQSNYGLAPYVAYDGSANYSHRPAGALKAIDGLTCGGWFQMTSGDFLMGVWQTAANQIWRLFVNSSAPTFAVSETGADSFSVASANVVAGQWYFIAARYTPSEEIAIWCNDVKTIDTASIPSALYDSATAEFTIGGDHAGANLLTGKAALCWISHVPLADNYLILLYHMQRRLFGS